MKEIEDKLELTDNQFQKKLEGLDVQEKSIEGIQEMLNIKIEESIESKMMFLNG